MLVLGWPAINLSLLINSSQQLNVDKDEVEKLLMGLILERKVKGRIDQVNSLLELDSL
jgi:PCI domain